MLIPRTEADLTALKNTIPQSEDEIWLRLFRISYELFESDVPKMQFDFEMSRDYRSGPQSAFANLSEAYRQISDEFQQNTGLSVSGMHEQVMNAELTYIENIQRTK